MAIQVLLVDDEKTIRGTMAAYLEDEGFKVLQAGSGEEAVAMVGEGCRPDVCIMDMRLPGMDGHDAILALHDILRGLRFLIHTGSLSYALTDHLRAIGVGDEALFRKPLQDMRVLAEAIEVLATQNAQDPGGHTDLPSGKD